MAYVLSAPDNNAYMLAEGASYPACPTCGLATDREWINPGFKPGDVRLDASYTYDGYLIVSERFRSATQNRGAQFIELPAAPGFYSLVSDDEVPLDAEKRETVFEQPCERCGRFFVVAGATPAFLKLAEPLPDRLFRTDIKFGTGNEQAPLTVVGPGLAAQLRETNLVAGSTSCR